MIAPEAGLSVSRQCTLLGVARSGFYYRPRPESAEELELLERLDRIFTDHPVYGSRRLQVALLREGIPVGRRRVRRLMRKLALWAVRPKRNTSKRHSGHKVYPYLLRGRTIDQPNQAWAADITPAFAGAGSTSPCDRGFCTWSRSSTGRPDGCCPGGYRTR
jgi:putative transposase